MNFTDQQLNYGVVCGGLARRPSGVTATASTPRTEGKPGTVRLLDLERKILFSECAHWPISSDSPVLK